MVAAAFTVMCLIFGTTFLAIKIGVEAGMPPFYRPDYVLSLQGH